MYEKSIQTTYKIHVRKGVAKSMETDAKMEPKWRPRSVENLKIFKKTCRKSMLNFDAEKNTNPPNDTRRACPQEGDKGGGKPPPWEPKATRDIN